MTEFVHLLGAEEVRSAGNAMREAANTISGAAGNLDFTLNRLSPQIEEWVSRIEQALRPQESNVGASAFEGWAIVELMGHRRIAGRVTETEIAGAKLLRVDIPGDGTDDYATQFVGGASIYCLTPTTEEMARAAAKSSRPEPVTRWELPRPKPVAAAPKCDGEIDVDCFLDRGHDGPCQERTSEPMPRAKCKHGQPEDRNCEMCIEEEGDDEDLDEEAVSGADVAGGMEEQPDGTTHFEEAVPSPTREELIAAAQKRIAYCTKCAIPSAFESHTCKPEDHDLVKCHKCHGEGKVANSDDQEPWSAWSSLPPGSDAAVRMGIVAPIDCPKCKGTGKAA